MNIKKILPAVFKQGSQIIAATANPLLQIWIPDPTGIIPNSIGVVMSTVGETIADTLDRNMSQQEVIRTNKTYIYFVEKLERNLNQGHQIRNDDFFRSPVGYRKPAEELFEGMLVKARNQYEEAKIEFFSNLYANGCVDLELSPQMISLFILILDRLSFNHLDLLNRFEILGQESLWQANDPYTLQKENPLLLTCIEELKNLNLITPTFWGDSPLVISDLGAKFIKSIEFKSIFEFTPNDCISRNNPNR
ncbi:hypothetical protein [Acinetobacter vivianii]|uniref:hypothetical protein n=1 Tax=Acinetobacter vivianii TaxID=1776742 RepID=UPI002DBF1DB2|nr:hypothetical protein [Acinetobacter vivianii]MEB6481051.1 hypothetical protein [Acinetobacter vivianii]MEB6659335.1 hypothetical protein [Acinetobacter vivianii]